MLDAPHPHSPNRNSGTLSRISGSVALHAALVGALLYSTRSVQVRSFVPGTASGTHIELTYLPGRKSFAAPPVRRKPAPPAVSKTSPAAAKSPELAVSQPLSPSPAPAVAREPNGHSDSPAVGEAATASNDALGNDNIRIALTTYSPSPKPDLSRLPHGTHGDVVIDITIDPTGKVADLQILQSLGYGVEGSVADTIRTWRFQPATRDGIPVASVQELHFHFAAG